MQSLLYWRRSFSPRKKDHSSRHFLLRFITRHDTEASSPEPCLGLVRPALPLRIFQSLLDRGAFLRRGPPRRALSFLQFLPALAIVGDSVNHAVVVLQGHLGGAQGAIICPPRLMNCSAECSMYFSTISGGREVKVSSPAPPQGR